MKKFKDKEKLTGLDFYDASRIVSATDRALRHSGGLWLMFKLIPGGSCALVLRDDPNGERKWPLPEEMDEKCWEVESEENDE